MDLYREEILEHWRNPQNYGEMKKPDFVIEQVNPLCGDEVTFYFKIAPRVSSSRHGPDKWKGKRGSGNLIPDQVGNDKVIKDVSFTGSGCAISIVSASLLSENIKGKPVADLGKITGQDVLGLIGGNVAPARLKCAFLALEAIRKLGGDYFG